MNQEVMAWGSLQHQGGSREDSTGQQVWLCLRDLSSVVEEMLFSPSALSCRKLGCAHTPGPSRGLRQSSSSEMDFWRHLGGSVEMNHGL
ncbi:hypothetical protein GN956_G12357 [Arapaima gigas]